MNISTINQLGLESLSFITMGIVIFGIGITLHGDKLPFNFPMREVFKQMPGLVGWLFMFSGVFVIVLGILRGVELFVEHYSFRYINVILIYSMIILLVIEITIVVGWAALRLLKINWVNIPVHVIIIVILVIIISIMTLFFKNPEFFS
ncbi:hypothetical protein HYY69_01440 [Candidatus Woesearchaeota archaeon]|nr:hypothetical protein [Candidatus Woesearchaeota archaeon]